jgi:hypothetical protein
MRPSLLTCPKRIRRCGLSTACEESRRPRGSGRSTESGVTKPLGRQAPTSARGRGTLSLLPSRRPTWPWRPAARSAGKLARTRWRTCATASWEISKFEQQRKTILFLETTSSEENALALETWRRAPLYCVRPKRHGSSHSRKQRIDSLALDLVTSTHSSATLVFLGVLLFRRAATASDALLLAARLATPRSLRLPHDITTQLGSSHALLRSLSSRSRIFARSFSFGEGG